MWDQHLARFSFLKTYLFFKRNSTCSRGFCQISPVWGNEVGKKQSWFSGPGEVVFLGKYSVLQIKMLEQFLASPGVLKNSFWDKWNYGNLLRGSLQTLRRIC